jgi:two-component system, OmpR family, response regulator
MEIPGGTRPDPRQHQHSLPHQFTILLADDSSLLRQNIRKLLSGVIGTARVIETATIGDTLKELKLNIPEIVVLDLQFPDGSGFDVLNHLDAVCEWPEPRPFVVVLTNFPSAGNKEKAMSLGANHFLDKSYEYEQLIQVLDIYITHFGSKESSETGKGGE